jgi:hypothetical protein
LAKKRAEEPARAAKALKEKKVHPDPVHGDAKDPRNFNKPDWMANLKTPTLGSADNGGGYWASRDRNPAPSQKNESWLRFQEQTTGTVRGHEYIVPHPDKSKPPVEYDGWDSSRQTFLEAKNGYGTNKKFVNQKSGELTDFGKQQFLDEAQRQVDAADGRAIEWHFSNERAAKATRKVFEKEGLDIEVIWTKAKPGGPKKPEAFD